MRRAVISFIMIVLGGMVLQNCQAQTVGERYLFSAVNQERAALGLAPVKWDGQLAAAARQHAMQMARRGAISHQFAGEADLAARTSSAGALFSRVTENVGMAPSAVQMHTAWMHSSGHRENILDSQVTSLGVAVVVYGGMLWAVEDFSRDTAALTLDAQEKTVIALIQNASGIDHVVATADARQSCQTQSGFAGSVRPAFVMRYTTTDLTRLPQQLTSRFKGGTYTSAAVGACAKKQGSFSEYNLAILLYR